MEKTQLYWYFITHQLVSLLVFNGFTLSYVISTWLFCMFVVIIELSLFLWDLFKNNWIHPMNGFNDYIQSDCTPYEIIKSNNKWHGIKKEVVPLDYMWVDYFDYAPHTSKFSKHFK